MHDQATFLALAAAALTALNEGGWGSQCQCF